MARPKEFDQEKALRKAICLFSQQGFAATSTDDLMRVMGVGRQSMYDTFGDKRALFLKALKMYVTQSVRSINAELERPGSALSAIRYALVTFAERKDLSSAEGCMGLNAISEFGQRDSQVTHILRNAARVQRKALMRVLARARKHGELSSGADLDSMADFFESTLAGIRIAAKAGQESAGTSEYRSLCGESVHGIRSSNRSRVTSHSEIDPVTGRQSVSGLPTTHQLITFLGVPYTMPNAADPPRPCTQRDPRDHSSARKVTLDSHRGHALAVWNTCSAG